MQCFSRPCRKLLTGHRERGCSGSPGLATAGQRFNAITIQPVNAPPIMKKSRRRRKPAANLEATYVCDSCGEPRIAGEHE